MGGVESALHKSTMLASSEHCKQQEMVKSTKYFRVWMIFLLTLAYSAVKSTILADSLSVFLSIICVQTGACTIMTGLELFDCPFQIAHHLQ